jgi:hypothetical protein
MITVDDVLKVFRRRIGDTDTPFTYEDDLLYGYISDAVNQVEIDYNRGISVNITTEGDITTATFDSPIDLQGGDAQLFAIKAHYIITLRTKDRSDRDNFRMVKGRLTLDNTNQSKDHAETLRLLDIEYKNTLYKARTGGFSIKGVRVE